MEIDYNPKAFSENTWSALGKITNEISLNAMLGLNTEEDRIRFWNCNAACKTLCKRDTSLKMIWGKYYDKNNPMFKLLPDLSNSISHCWLIDTKNNNHIIDLLYPYSPYNGGVYASILKFSEC